jgi:hypothetical protein
VSDPTFHYKVASEDERTHHVFAVHDKSPACWMLVATFVSRPRADDYADLHNGAFLDDGDPENTKMHQEYGDLTVPPEPAEAPQVPVFERIVASVLKALRQPDAAAQIRAHLAPIGRSVDAKTGESVLVSEGGGIRIESRTPPPPVPPAAEAAAPVSSRPAPPIAAAAPSIYYEAEAASDVAAATEALAEGEGKPLAEVVAEFDTEALRQRGRAVEPPAPGGLYGNAETRAAEGERYAPPEPEAGAPAPKAETLADRTARENRVRDERRALVIQALQRAPRPLRRADLIAKVPQIPEGSMFHFLSGMLADRLITRDTDGAYALPLAKARQDEKLAPKLAAPRPEPTKVAPAPDASATQVEPEPARAKGMTETQKALADKIKADYAEGRQPTWAEMAQAAGVREAGLGYVILALEDLKVIVRDQHGIRPWGAQPLPGTAAPKAAEPEPAPAPKAKSEQDLIDEHVRTKGVSRAAEESPSLDDILEELKTAGRKVKANETGTLFEINGKRMWRDGLLTEANKLRVMRGAPVWDSRKVRWPRVDGTTEPEHERASA